MSDPQPMTANPRGVIDAPVTLFTLNNKYDSATFPPVVEFLLRNTASTALADFHRTESLNLMLDTRRAHAKCAVEVAARRVHRSCK